MTARNSTQTRLNISITKTFFVAIAASLVGCGAEDAEKPAAMPATTVTASATPGRPVALGVTLPPDGYAIGDSERPGIDLYALDGRLVTSLPTARFSDDRGGGPAGDIRIMIDRRHWTIGGGASELRPAPRKPDNPPSSEDAQGTDCVVTDRKNGVDFAVCPGDRDTPETIVAIQGEQRTVLAKNALPLASPFKSSGTWRWAVASSDGKWLLAQHSGECEVPHAFFVPTTPGAILPPSDRAESFGLGWASTGEALIGFGKGLCGDAGNPPGIYAVRPGGEPRLVIAYASEPPDANSTQRIEVWNTP